jgi:hypothetical protein
VDSTTMNCRQSDIVLIAEVVANDNRWCHNIYLFQGTYF